MSRPGSLLDYFRRDRWFAAVVGTGDQETVKPREYFGIPAPSARLTKQDNKPPAPVLRSVSERLLSRTVDPLHKPSEMGLFRSFVAPSMGSEHAAARKTVDKVMV